jgi:hypothetical protein
MEQVVVGTYEFGFERAVLVLREGKAANAEFVPDSGGPVRILIGADEKQWRDIVESLVHEVQEIIMTKMECSWAPGYYIGNDSSRCKFTMSHMQFQEMCCRTAEFITPALPALAKAWEAWKKPALKKSSMQKYPSPKDYPNDKDFKKAIRGYYQKASAVKKKGKK